MKIFLTGQKQIGKSTCIGTFLEKSQMQACGFQTLPVYENGKRIGFCIHALVEMEDNDRRFSIQHDTYNEVIPGVFDSFGCQVLEKSMEYPSRILILDEIGVLEREEAAYLELLNRRCVLHEQVLGVLKRRKRLTMHGCGKIQSLKFWIWMRFPLKRPWTFCAEVLRRRMEESENRKNRDSRPLPQSFC